MKTLLVGAVLVSLSLATAASAQQATAIASTIRVTGNALVNAKPDRVEIDVGVEAQAAQAQDAATQNATKLNDVLAALRKLIGPGADIRTFSYALTPNYRSQPGGTAPTISGYTATNLVRVNLDDLTKVGAVIDTATRSGESGGRHSVHAARP